MILKYLLGALLVVQAAFAQTSHLDALRFEHLSVEDGLSQGTINAILQDRLGFLWIATEDGLNRYDGYEFKIYKHNPENSDTPIDNYIRTLCLDGNGQIWMGTDGKGISVLNPETETFRHYLHDAEDSTSLGSNSIETIYMDDHNTMWIGTWGGGLNRYSEASATFTRFTSNSTSQQPLNNDKIWSIYNDSQGLLWIGTDGGGVNLVPADIARSQDPANLNFRYFQNDSLDITSISNNAVVAFLEDQHGIFWVATYYNGLNQFDRNSETFKRYQHDPDDPYSLSDNIIWNMAEDNQGEVWIATMAAGLNIYDREQDRFIRIPGNTRDPDGLNSGNIRAMFEDRTGVLWIGTMVAGLNKIDRKPRKFHHFKHQSGNPNSLAFDFVFTICEDKQGNIWIGTYGGGISRFSPQLQIFKHYNHDADNPASLSSDQVRMIYEDSQGNIWAGCYFGGLNRYVPERDAFRHYLGAQNNDNGLLHNNIRAIYEDSRGRLWIGTNGGGVHRYDADLDRFYHYDSGNLDTEYILTITEGPDGILWTGSYGGGLNRFDPETGNFFAYRHQAGENQSISSDVITEIFFDTKQTMWIGTYGDGLNRYQPDSETFGHITENDGLAGNIICGILEDQDGKLWISTNNGLSKFDPEQHTFRNYDISDGLQRGEMNPGAYCKGKDGTMYFGGSDGVNFFQPDQVQNNPFIPQIALTSFKVFERPVTFHQDIAYLQALDLSYQEKFFSFEYSALDFTTPGKNRYIYKLEGFDTEWLYPVHRRYASYTNLDPGMYTFRVRGSNNDGTWNDQGASVIINIIPPFWMTWWFRIVMTVLAAGLIAVIFYKRVSQLKKAKEAQEVFSKRLIEAQEQERKRIASELHDGLGQDLLVISNSIQHCIRLQSEDDATRSELKQLSEITRESIDEVREIASNLHPHQLDRLGFGKAVKAGLDKVAQSTDLQVHYDIDSIDGHLSKEKEINLYRIIQEALNNIVKHARAKHVEVRIEKKDPDIAVMISDDGNGFDPHAEKTRRNAGFGLTTMQERAKILAGTFTLNSGTGNGTEIIVRFPFDPKAEHEKS